jgi:hypothetical protein
MLLKLGSIDDAAAHRRASVLADDIEHIGFDAFQLSCRPYPVPSADRQIVATPLAEYQSATQVLAFIKLEIRMMTFRRGLAAPDWTGGIYSSFRKFPKSRSLVDSRVVAKKASLRTAKPRLSISTLWKRFGGWAVGPELKYPPRRTHQTGRCKRYRLAIHDRQRGLSLWIESELGGEASKERQHASDARPGNECA